MAKDSSNIGITSGGITLLGMFIVFLFLKLAQIGVVANWSWWWVTAPLWLPTSISLTVYILYILGVLFFGWLHSMIWPKRHAEEKKRFEEFVERNKIPKSGWQLKLQKMQEEAEARRKSR